MATRIVYLGDTMRVLTFKLKPKTIFGLVLLLTGFVAITLTFFANHNIQPTMASISCSSTQERVDYIESFGYKTDTKEASKQVIIPVRFNNVYNDYNEIQKSQGFNLERYKGKTVTLYTYNIINYKDNDNVIADLIVYDGRLIGADLCDPSVDNGFLVALNGQN